MTASTRQDAIKRLAAELVQHVRGSREDSAAGMTAAAFAVAALCQEERLRVEDVTELVAEAGKSLDMAHRDPKPGNAQARIVGMKPFARITPDGLSLVVFIPTDIGTGAHAVVGARSIASELRAVAADIDEAADIGPTGAPVGKA